MVPKGYDWLPTEEFGKAFPYPEIFLRETFGEWLVDEKSLYEEYCAYYKRKGLEIPDLPRFRELIESREKLGYLPQIWRSAEGQVWYSGIKLRGTP